MAAFLMTVYDEHAVNYGILRYGELYRRPLIYYAVTLWRLFAFGGIVMRS